MNEISIFLSADCKLLSSYFRADKLLTSATIAQFSVLDTLWGSCRRSSKVVNL